MFGKLCLIFNSCFYFNFRRNKELGGIEPGTQKRRGEGGRRRREDGRRRKGDGGKRKGDGRRRKEDGIPPIMRKIQLPQIKNFSLAFTQGKKEISSHQIQVPHPLNISIALFNDILYSGLILKQNLEAAISTIIKTSRVIKKTDKTAVYPTDS